MNGKFEHQNFQEQIKAITEEIETDTESLETRSFTAVDMKTATNTFREMQKSMNACLEDTAPAEKASQEEAKKVFYLRSFDPELHQIDPLSSQYHQLEVPDPYNQPEGAYEKVLKMIESAVDGFIDTITPAHGA